MIKKRIVITGGPGTGKTSIINTLEKTGFFCFPEIIRSMTQEVLKDSIIESNPINSVPDAHLFNTMILNGRVSQFKDAFLQKEDLIFYDRGVPDVLAYMHYFDQQIDNHFIKICKEYRYDHVFILPPWKEIYVSDEGRFESFEQAKEIHLSLEEIYRKFGYQCKEVPFETIEKRCDFIIKNIL